MAATRFRAGVLVLTMLVGAAVPVAAPPAQTSGEAADEDRLVRKIAAEVLRELREGDILKQAIRDGIRDFVAERRRAQTAGRSARAKQVRRVSVERDHIFGNPDAIVSLIEYSDFECPFCKRFHATAKQVVEESGGQVNWVYRHFPLAFHNPGAQREAEASECANELGGNDAFWRYADAIFARTTSNGRGFPIRNLTPLAAELGLDANAFEECLASGRYTAHVKADFDDGVKAGIAGTPGNILLHNRSGAVRTIAGAVPAARVKAEIERLLQ